MALAIINNGSAFIKLFNYTIPYELPIANLVALDSSTPNEPSCISSLPVPFWAMLILLEISFTVVFLFVVNWVLLKRHIQSKIAHQGEQQEVLALSNQINHTFGELARWTTVLGIKMRVGRDWMKEYKVVSVNQLYNKGRGRQRSLAFYLKNIHGNAKALLGALEEIDSQAKAQGKDSQEIRRMIPACKARLKAKVVGTAQDIETEPDSDDTREEYIIL